eukprot:TRINITY_DN8984_c0_g1_i3.p1 TRINITY_DN8984_c0_g1~~TRINITY_DN8984_c0_g1_i3.p1  ORF type:complete len:141 (+),score=29.07 TRINITY_DN8984_c0_g1_i3:109-531(+)
MRQGNLEKQLLTMMKENLGKPSDQQKTINPQPPSFLSRERKPLVYLDINLKERMVRLPLFRGEDPKEVALRFQKEHELSDKMAVRLERLIRQQFEGLSPQKASAAAPSTKGNNPLAAWDEGGRNHQWPENMSEIIHQNYY